MLLLVVCLGVGCRGDENADAPVREGEHTKGSEGEIDKNLDMMHQYDPWKADRECREADDAAREEQGIDDPHVPIPAH